MGQYRCVIIITYLDKTVITCFSIIPISSHLNIALLHHNLTMVMQNEIIEIFQQSNVAS